MSKKVLEKVYAPAIRICSKISMLGTRMRKGRKPYGSEELNLIAKALISQNLFSIGGKMISKLEQEFAQTYDVPYAVASTSGTAAIHVALGALDLSPGDEVITAPVTDMGTIAPILLQNTIPVFADIDETYNMDPEDVERKITSRTRAIIAVHLFGNPCDLDAIAAVAKRHSIPLIEDCAQAHLTKYKGKYVGTIGDIGCFSFQQSKHMTTGEGGMTVTSNKAYYERMKLFIDKGWARKGWGSRAYLFLAPNYRPTELVGAVGLAQLRKVGEVVRKRRELGEYLTELLSKVEGLTPAPVTPDAEHSYWLYPILINENIDAELLAKKVMGENVWVSVGYTGKPIYLCTEALTAKKTYGESSCPFTCRYTTGSYEYKEGLCPKAEKTLKHLLGLPIDESWTRADVEHAADVISRSIKTLQQKTTLAPAIQVRQAKPIEAPVKRLEAKDEKKIHLGIVGCGQMGRWHLDACKQNPRVKLVAFADTEVFKAQQFANETSASAYSSHRQIIDNESLDGVIICTVPSTHSTIALDFLNAGVNVLCEKPLAISASQAREMVEKAKEKDLQMLTAFKFRFFDEVAKTKELIDKGFLGRILNFRLMFGGYLDMSGSWFSQKELSGGGVIMDNAGHAVDLVRYLFGGISSISAQARNYQKIAVEDSAKLTLFLESGCFGTVDVSWDISVPSNAYLEIFGEDGSAFLDIEGVTYKLKTWNEWKRINNRATMKEAFSRQVDHFANAIITRKPTVLTNEDGLKTQIVIDAAYKSLKKNSPVDTA